MQTVHDAIVVSDIHLGLPSCNARAFTRLVGHIRCGVIETNKLVINGDLFDSGSVDGWPDSHWRALDSLRDFANDRRFQTVFVKGNHDPDAEHFRILTGFPMVDRHRVGDALILHGHDFDSFLNRHPRITAVADAIYRAAQKRKPAWANRIKDHFIGWADHASDVENGARQVAMDAGYKFVVAGHTHIAKQPSDCGIKGGLGYYNAGSWVSGPCYWIGIAGGKVTLNAV